MAKKVNPMVAIVGGFFALLFLFSIIAIVFYPPAPTGGHDDHSPDAPHVENNHKNDTHDNETEKLHETSTTDFSRIYDSTAVM